MSVAASGLGPPLSCAHWLLEEGFHVGVGWADEVGVGWADEVGVGLADEANVGLAEEEDADVGAGVRRRFPTSIGAAAADAAAEVRLALRFSLGAAGSA